MRKCVRHACVVIRSNIACCNSLSDSKKENIITLSTNVFNLIKQDIIQCLILSHDLNKKFFEEVSRFNVMKALETGKYEEKESLLVSKLCDIRSEYVDKYSYIISHVFKIFETVIFKSIEEYAAFFQRFL